MVRTVHAELGQGLVLARDDLIAPRGTVLAGATGCHHPQGRSEGVYGSFNLADHVGDAPAAVSANRAVLSAALGGAPLHFLQQVHGAAVVEAGAQPAAVAPEADAAWTRVPGVALVIMTADCVPVMVAAQDGSAVGAAHAGWQGLAGGVLTQLVAAMPGTRFSAWIGPCISAPRYEVGEDVWRRFAGAPDNCFSSVPGAPAKRFLDLAGLAAWELALAGVAVQAAGLCAYDDTRFYSHRRATHAGQTATGRMGTFVLLRP